MVTYFINKDSIIVKKKRRAILIDLIHKEFLFIFKKVFLNNNSCSGQYISRKRGFDPNKWFFNVEKIAAEFIGRETVEYVANINKYYVAYKLQVEGNQKRERSKRTFTALTGR